MDRNYRCEDDGVRIASIDIGTNTILMLIVDVKKEENKFQIDVVDDFQVIARLGKGVDEHRRILPETIQRATNFLKEYKQIADEHHAERILACGTSALRDATNRDEFIHHVKNETGIDIKVLSGIEEADATYHGAVSEFLELRNNFTVLDIGGGSTEVVTGDAHAVHQRQSFDIGSVRISERILKTSPPLPENLRDADEYINSVFRNSHFTCDSNAKLIGVAGTVTTLAAIDLQLERYDRKKVSGYKLRLSTIENIFQQLRPLTLDQIKNIPQISAGRSDILIAGVMILKTFMKFSGYDEVTVSDRGLRYGLVIEAIKDIDIDR